MFWIKLLVLLAMMNPGAGTCLSGDCENGYGKYVFHDGGTIYQGQFTEGKFNGSGILDRFRHFGPQRRDEIRGAFQGRVLPRRGQPHPARRHQLPGHVRNGQAEGVTRPGKGPRLAGWVERRRNPNKSKASRLKCWVSFLNPTYDAKVG